MSQHTSYTLVSVSHSQVASPEDCTENTSQFFAAVRQVRRLLTARLLLLKAHQKRQVDGETFQNLGTTLNLELCDTLKSLLDEYEDYQTAEIKGTLSGISQLLENPHVAQRLDHSAVIKLYESIKECRGDSLEVRNLYSDFFSMKDVAISKQCEIMKFFGQRGECGRSDANTSTEVTIRQVHIVQNVLCAILESYLDEPSTFDLLVKWNYPRTFRYYLRKLKEEEERSGLSVRATTPNLESIDEGRGSSLVQDVSQLAYEEFENMNIEGMNVSVREE